MTIRDIMVSFGFDVDSASQAKAENSIKGIKNFATKMLGKVALVFSVAKLGQFTKECLQAGSDVQEMENKFNTVFDNISGEVDKWAGDFAESVGRNKNTIKTYLADNQNLLVGFGMSREEGAKLSEQMVSLALDIASFSNIDETRAVENMSKAIMGESECAKILGAVLNDTTRAETMRAMGLKGSYNKLSQLEKMQVNYNTILRQSPDAIGDCVRSMDSYESKQRQLKATIQGFKEYIGGKLIPVFAILTGWFNNLMKGIMNFTKDLLGADDETNNLLKVFERVQGKLQVLKPMFDRIAETISSAFKTAIQIVGKVAGVIGDTLLSAIDLILKGFDKLADMVGGMDNLFKILSLAVGAFFLVNKWDNIVLGALKVVKAIGTLKNAFTGLFTVANLKTLAIIAVIVMLALIVEDFVQFMRGNDSVIGALFDKAGIGAENARNAIKRAWNAIVTILKTAFDTIKQAVEMTFGTVKDFLKRNSDQIKKDLMTAWGIIAQALSGVWTVLSSIWKTIFGEQESDVTGSANNTKNGVLSVWQSILTALSTYWQAIFNVASRVFNTLATVIKAVFTVLKVFWDMWGSTIVQHFKVIWDTMKDTIKGFLQVIEGIANLVTAIFNGDWKGAWEAVKSIVSGVVKIVISLVKRLYSGIKTSFKMKFIFIKTILSKIKNIITTIWNAIVAKISSVLSKIKNKISTIWNGIMSFIKGVLNKIKSVIVSVWNAIMSVIRSVLNKIKSVVSSVWNAISSTVSSVLNRIKSIVSSVWNAIMSVIRSVLNSIKSTVSSVWNAISSTVSSVLNRIKSIVSSVWNAISSTVRNVLSRIRSTVSSVWNGIVSAVSGAVNRVRSVVSSVFGSIVGTVSSIFSRVRSAITGKMSSIKSAIKNGFSTAFNSIKNLGSRAFQWGADIINGIKNGIMSKINSIKQSVSSVGETIKSYLHFSVPDEGPLTDFESWMPDFMEGLAYGIDINKYKVLDKVRDLANGMSIIMTGATASPTSKATSMINNSLHRINQHVSISNTYNGLTNDTRRVIPSTMNKSAVDATTQLARGLQYARG